SPLRWLAKIVGLEAPSRWIPDRRHGEGRDEVSHGLYQALARCGFGPSTPTGNNIQAASAASFSVPGTGKREQGTGNREQGTGNDSAVQRPVPPGSRCCGEATRLLRTVAPYPP